MDEVEGEIFEGEVRAGKLRLWRGNTEKEEGGTEEGRGGRRRWNRRRWRTSTTAGARERACDPVQSYARLRSASRTYDKMNNFFFWKCDESGLIV